MDYLRDAGYRVVSLKDVRYHIVDRERQLDKLVAITFDDGYLDNYSYAVPILRMFNYDATIFLASGYISDPRRDSRYRMGNPEAVMLNWSEIREMEGQGISFGAHTHSHCDLTEVCIGQAKSEICMSKEVIEREIDAPVDLFCYPKGMFDETVQEIVREAGYLGACSVIPGRNTRSTNLYELRRTEISGDDSLLDFKKKLSGAYDAVHRYVQRRQHRKKATAEEHSCRKDVKRRIRVLHIIDSLVAEGAEQLLLDILSETDRESFEHVVCCLASGGPLVEEIQNAGVPVCIIGRKHKADLRSLAKMRNLIKEFQPDIVHTHLFTSSFWGRIAALITRRICVVTEHNTSHWKRWYHRLANRWLSTITARIIAVSQTVKDSLVTVDRVAADKITVIRNGVSLSRLVPNGNREEIRREFDCQDDDILAVTVAALDEQKGHRYLLESAKEFVRRRPKVKIACVGDGPLRKELEERVASDNLRENIIFTGVRRDIGDILDAADIFILPSLYEGLSISLLEAAAMAKPIITTSVGASREVFTDKETGLLVNTRDPSGITKAIEYCIDNKEEAFEMGKRASELVRSRFSIAKSVKEYESIYRELVGQRDHAVKA